MKAKYRFTQEEVQLQSRNHGMPLEMLKYDITPIGNHYTLNHFDIPFVQDEEQFEVSIEGSVRNPFKLKMKDLRERESKKLLVTMECAGVGRAFLENKPISQPWAENPGWLHFPSFINCSKTFEQTFL